MSRTRRSASAIFLVSPQMKMALRIVVLSCIAQWSAVAADITNVTLTVTRADGLARPANPQEVKSYWGVGLVVVAWSAEEIGRASCKERGKSEGDGGGV